jgi:hypothetical protein
LAKVSQKTEKQNTQNTQMTMAGATAAAVSEYDSMGEDPDEEAPPQSRKSYTIRQKRVMVFGVDKMVLSNAHTTSSACRVYKIQPSQYRRWKAKEPAMKKAINQKATTLHAGPPSCIMHLEDDILEWFDTMRGRGLVMNINMIVMKAAELDGVFRRRTMWSKLQAVRRLNSKYGLVYRATTNESQRLPSEVREEALGYVEAVRPRLVGRHEDYIINMDQTPVFFSMTAKKTLERRGARTVNARKSTGDTRRVSVLVTVTASGKMLPALILFKGVTVGGRIKQEFPTYPQGHHYGTQPNAWCDQYHMNNWIDTILKPYVKSAPPGVVPFLLLDKYKCHLMPSVIEKIESLGVEVEHIPSGCTGLVQPVDVGIGKPLKNHCRNLWNVWMMSKGVDEAVIKPPTRKEVAEWISESLTLISVDTVRNSWRHHRYGYLARRTALVAAV